MNTHDTIIVTGAAGFIGRNVVAELNRRGYTNLLLVDHLGTDEKWSNLVNLHFENLVSPERFLSMVETDQLPRLRPAFILGLAARRPKRTPTFCSKTTIATPAHCASGA